MPKNKTELRSLLGIWTQTLNSTRFVSFSCTFTFYFVYFPTDSVNSLLLSIKGNANHTQIAAAIALKLRQFIEREREKEREGAAVQTLLRNPRAVYLFFFWLLLLDIEMAAIL